ncbi:DNA cytosine methyltransferase [Catenulispora yoronensis]
MDIRELIAADGGSIPASEAARHILTVLHNRRLTAALVSLPPLGLPNDATWGLLDAQSPGCTPPSGLSIRKRADAHPGVVRWLQRPGRGRGRGRGSLHRGRDNGGRRGSPGGLQDHGRPVPGPPNLGDARDIDWKQLRGKVDTVSCGFPCQDISDSGTREGITGERSGLWFTIAHAIRIIRPRHVYLENVSAIRNRGQAAVLTSLHTIGYDTSWTTLRASDIGAAHHRDRWFAYATPTHSAGR